MELTDKQRKFVTEYAKTGNGTQSAIKAGYSKKTANRIASQLLSKLDIQEALKKLTEKYEKKSIADIQEMQEALTNIIRQTMTEEVLMAINQGEYTEVVKENKKPYIKDVISAINTLGKMQGAFTEQLKIDLTPTVIKDDLENE